MVVINEWLVRIAKWLLAVFYVCFGLLFFGTVYLFVSAWEGVGGGWLPITISMLCIVAGFASIYRAIRLVVDSHDPVDNLLRTILPSDSFIHAWSKAIYTLVALVLKYVLWFVVALAVVAALVLLVTSMPIWATIIIVLLILILFK